MMTDKEEVVSDELDEVVMSDDEDRKLKMKTLKLGLFLGELLIKNGAETYRVEDSVIRLCKSMGFFYINVFCTPTVIILSDDRFDGLCYMKTISYRSINLNKISLLNNFSRDFVSRTNVDFKEAFVELKKIDKLKPYPPWFIYLCSGLASAFFSAMIGGNQLVTFCLTFIVAIFTSFAFDQIFKLSGIIAFSSAFSAFLIALIGEIFTYIGILSNPTMLIVGGIMPLLPGVAFVQAIRDMISGNLMAGVARFFDAAVILLSIASGVGLVLFFFKLRGGA